MKSLLQISSLLFALMFITSASSSDAVSRFNGKIDTFYGNVDGKEAKMAAGSVTMPLSSQFGLQLDAVGGTVGSNHLDGYGGHLFWRDADVGLFGLTGSRAEYRSNVLERTGVEAEYYLKKFTVAGAHGRQTGDVAHSNYHRLQLTYYPIEELAITLGGSRDIHRDRLNLDLEYQTRFNGLALFANSSRGENGYDHTLAGFRYYFGESKSLQKRHREDDPLNPLIASASNFAQRIEHRAILRNKFIAELKADFEVELGGEVTLDLSGFIFPTNDFLDAHGPIVATRVSPDDNQAPVVSEVFNVINVQFLHVCGNCQLDD